MTVTRDQILSALSRIALPDGGDLVSRDLVRALMVDEGQVRFVLEAPDPDMARRLEPVRQAAEAAVRALGVAQVSVVLTAHGPAPKAAPPTLKIGGHPTPQAGPQKVAGVDRILAIASGKGGVGKSTVSSNLAVALARQGRRVGLLDADIYGPSQPRMMGLSKRPASPDGKTIIPLQAHGVTVMSIGLMLKENEAVVWRGPMLMGALQQLLNQVAWGDLDVLVVDLPPGTGDVQLTLCQKTPCHRRDHRIDPAGCGASGCPPRHRHVRQAQDPDSGPDREHVHLSLSQLRARGAYLRSWRGCSRSGKHGCAPSGGNPVKS